MAPGTVGGRGDELAPRSESVQTLLRISIEGSAHLSASYMHRTFILIGALAAAACATQAPTPPVPSALAPTSGDVSRQVVSFQARTVTAKGAVTDDIMGTAEVRQRDIRVVLQSGYLELTASSAARPRGVRAILAYGDTANWNMRSRGSSVSVTSIHARGDTLTDVVEFTIPLPDGVELSDHWIALLLEADVYVAGRGWMPGSFRPIHGTRGIFSGLTRR